MVPGFRGRGDDCDLRLRYGLRQAGYAHGRSREAIRIRRGIPPGDWAGRSRHAWALCWIMLIELPAAVEHSCLATFGSSGWGVSAVTHATLILSSSPRLSSRRCGAAQWQEMLLGRRCYAYRRAPECVALQGWDAEDYRYRREQNLLHIATRGSSISVWVGRCGCRSRLSCLPCRELERGRL